MVSSINRYNVVIVRRCGGGAINNQPTLNTNMFWKIL